MNLQDGRPDSRVARPDAASQTCQTHEAAAPTAQDKDDTVDPETALQLSPRACTINLQPPFSADVDIQLIGAAGRSGRQRLEPAPDATGDVAHHSGLGTRIVRAQDLRDLTATTIAHDGVRRLQRRSILRVRLTVSAGPSHAGAHRRFIAERCRAR